MQEEILNTPNLTVLARPVNDIILARDELSPDPSKLKVAGVVLGNQNKVESNNPVNFFDHSYIFDF
jgi:hypothetical protein